MANGIGGLDIKKLFEAVIAVVIGAALIQPVTDIIAAQNITDPTVASLFGILPLFVGLAIAFALFTSVFSMVKGGR